MDAVTAGPASTAGKDVGKDAERDPRFAAARREGGGDEGREMLAHAAMGAKLSEAEERSGLEWLLGAARPLVHAVPVDYETPVGMVKLWFVVRAIDTRKIDEIEQRHVNAGTGRIDRLSADCEIVADATAFIEDAAGGKLDPRGDEFLTVEIVDRRSGESVRRKLASPALALERHFHDQLGLVGAVAMEIRRASGYDAERVGSAQRRLVDAALG